MAFIENPEPKTESILEGELTSDFINAAEYGVKQALADITLHETAYTSRPTIIADSEKEK